MTSISPLPSHLILTLPPRSNSPALTAPFVRALTISYFTSTLPSAKFLKNASCFPSAFILFNVSRIRGSCLPPVTKSFR